MFSHNTLYNSNYQTLSKLNSEINCIWNSYIDSKDDKEYVCGTESNQLVRYKLPNILCVGKPKQK